MPSGDFTTVPATSTQSMPTDSWAGFSTVERSATVVGVEHHDVGVGAPLEAALAGHRRSAALRAGGPA